MNKIKGRMRELNISQEELSTKIGVSPSTLNLKLCGKVQFKLSEVKKIMEILEIPQNEIAIYFF